MISESRKELRGYYFEEVQSYIPSIRRDLAILQAGENQRECIEEIHRLLHNIKGAASQVCLPCFSACAELAEYLLFQAIRNEKTLSAAEIAYISESVEKISEYCVAGHTGETAERAMLSERYRVFENVQELGDEAWIVSLRERIIALLLMDTESQKGMTATMNRQGDPARAAVTKDALAAAVGRIGLLVDRLGEQPAGAAGYRQCLLAIEEALADISACTGGAGLVEETFFSDFNQLLAEAGAVTDPGAPEQVIGRFVSLLCMQVESMLLGAMAAPGTVVDGVDEDRELSALLQRYVSSLEGLLALSGRIDADSARRLRGRIDHCRVLLDVGAAGPEPEEFPFFGDEGEPVAAGPGEPLQADDFSDSIFQDDELFAGGATGDEEDALYEIFREESEDHLMVINRTLNALEQRVVEPEALSPEVRGQIGEMRRAVHTLKGAAAMVGYGQIATCAHGLEDMLDWLHDEAGRACPEDILLLAQGVQLLEMLSRHPGGDRGGLVAALQNRITARIDQHAAGRMPAQHEAAVTKDALAATVSRIGLLVDRLGEQPAGAAGYRQCLLAIEEALADISACTGGAGLVEETFFSDFNQLLAEAGAVTDPGAPEQVIGRFVSLLCMQVESMLLGAMAAPGTVVDGVDEDRELSALLQRYVSSLEGLLALSGRIDADSARRLRGRIDHCRVLLDVGAAGPEPEEFPFFGDEGEPVATGPGEPLQADDFSDSIFQDDELFAGGATGDEEDALYEIFREESEDHLMVINRTLNALEQRVVEPEALSPEVRGQIGEMRRAVHTLKGAAAMVGYGQIATCAHGLEDMLDWLHDEAGHIGPLDLRVLATAIDLIESLSSQPGSDNTAGIAVLQQMIAKHLHEGQATAPPESGETDTPDGDPVPPEASAEQEMSVAAEDAGDEQEAGQIPVEEAPMSPSTGNIRVRIENLDEIIRIEGELVVARSSMEGILNEVKLSVDELQSAQGKLRRIAQELEAGFEVQSLYGFGPETLGDQEVSGRRGSSGFSEFDPIELDRYSQLNLIIRSLNELSVDISSIHGGMVGQFGELTGYVARQQLIMGSMQDKLMRTRMTPMSAISRAFFRTVRNTAAQLAKNVRLTVTGDDVYMDRFIWSKLTDPIMHILRNCVDHGIETADVRRDKGKPETASIRIEAQQRGSFVVLRISDDGAGIDMAGLREKLRATGLVSNPENIPDDELLPYLFRTGLSTREEISQVSGRGVGLDVVQKNIQELRGTVQVESRAGEGTAFELRIPITLSINKAILVMAGERLYAIPLQDIVEINSIALAEIAGGDKRLNWREERLPLKDLSVLLQLRGPLTLEPKSTGSCSVLIVQTGKGHVAMMIDEVRDQREIVIKDLGTYLHHVKGVSGVTILGDGSLIPVLNLSELVDESTPAPAKEKAPQLQARELPLQILIVDDSISVRQSIARLIRHQSWRSEMAVDGVDALDKLESFHPDAIILDIEMPRMNGYEFMSILRKNEKFSSIPVIMLTSRTSDKHRAKAEELGVDHYLNKPFQEEAFVKLLGGMRQYRQARTLPDAG